MFEDQAYNRFQRQCRKARCRRRDGIRCGARTKTRQHSGVRDTDDPQSELLRDHDVRHQGPLHHRRSGASGPIVAVRCEEPQCDVRARIGGVSVHARTSRSPASTKARSACRTAPPACDRSSARSTKCSTSVGGSPTKVTLGNPNLKPAFSRETEGGFNLNFLKNFTPRVQLLQQEDQRPDPAGSDVVGDGLPRTPG